MKKWILFAACVACIDWTRLSGTVKSLNLKDSTVTVQNRDGDLLTIPVDYQVKISDKHGELKGLKNLQLDEKITLIRMLSNQEKEENFDEMNKVKG